MAQPQLSIMPLENSLVSKTLNARNPFDRVFNISGGYNTFTQLTNMMNNGGSKMINTEIYEKAVIGELNVITQIASNAVSGSNLVITFSDPAYANFRIDDVVMDSNRVKGHVISTTPGTVTIMPDIGNTFNSATMFIANMFIKTGWRNQSTRNSVGSSSLYNTPDVDYNYSMVMRDSNYLAQADMIDTYVKTKNGNWFTAQEMQMIDRFAKATEFRNAFSDRGQTQLGSGVANSNGGLVWSIKNRGGSYISSSSAINQSTWTDMIRQATIKKAQSKSKLLFLHGKQALYDVQNFTSDFVKYSGINNTFGGKEVSGLDIQEWAIAGTQVDFLHMPIFDDPQFFPEISSITGKPKMSSAFFLLDLSPIPAAYDNGGPMPAIEKFHFGNKEIRHGYIPGVVGADMGDPSAYMQGGKNLMVSDLDGVSSHIYSRNGIDIIDAKNMLMYELAS